MGEPDQAACALRRGTGLAKRGAFAATFGVISPHSTDAPSTLYPTRTCSGTPLPLFVSSTRRRQRMFASSAAVLDTPYRAFHADHAMPAASSSRNDDFPTRR